MKEPLDSHRELNAPAELLWRATLSLSLAVLAVGILLTIGGVVVWRLEWTGLGLAAVALACAGRCWLRRRRELEPRALEALWAEAPAPDESRAARLLELLERWEAMEGRRGEPDFDPWALQELRNEIRTVVESDPALEQLFDRLRQAA